MSVREITLPPYTQKMEIWNAISHGLGVLFAFICGPMAIAKAAQSSDVLGVTSVSIYVISMIVLYAGSALYHALHPSDAKRVMRVIDHDNIFLLVMGSYLPYCLIALRDPFGVITVGWILLGLVWGLSIVGIVLNSINIKKFKVLSLVMQIALGSVVLAAFYPLYFRVGWDGTLVSFISGVFYWIGAALYGIGHKDPWMHTVFHFFVLAGTVTMFFAIYFFVL